MVAVLDEEVHAKAVIGDLLKLVAVDEKVERAKMLAVCRQCHSLQWAESHFARLDAVVKNYNEEYFKPAKKMLDDLYAKKLLTTPPLLR